MTQTEVSKMLGIYSTFITKVEAGDNMSDADQDDKPKNIKSPSSSETDSPVPDGSTPTENSDREGPKDITTVAKKYREEEEARHQKLMENLSPGVRDHLRRQTEMMKGVSDVLEKQQSRLGEMFSGPKGIDRMGLGGLSEKIGTRASNIEPVEHKIISSKVMDEMTRTIREDRQREVQAKQAAIDTVEHLAEVVSGVENQTGVIAGLSKYIIASDKAQARGQRHRDRIQSIQHRQNRTFNKWSLVVGICTLVGTLSGIIIAVIQANTSRTPLVIPPAAVTIDLKELAPVLNSIDQRLARLEESRKKSKNKAKQKRQE